MKPNPNHIPLIHNYCDRWCERCAFTQKCAVYANASSERIDINNHAFWQKLSDAFTETKKLIHEKAAEHGIDLDEIMMNDKVDYKSKGENELMQVEVHPLIKMTTIYTDTAMELIDRIRSENTSLQKIETEINLGIKDEAVAMSEANEYINCMEVIDWYLMQIQIKFMRAISGTMLNSFDFEVEDDPDGTHFINDSDGSAKVALIGSDRSMMAWRKLMDKAPEKESDIISVLAQLQKIVRMGETTFPNARTTIRPGLDE
jgi:hypothetical protein